MKVPPAVYYQTREAARRSFSQICFVSAGGRLALLQSAAPTQAPPLRPSRDGVGGRGSHVLGGERSQEPKRALIERSFVVLFSLCVFDFLNISQTYF